MPLFLSAPLAELFIAIAVLLLAWAVTALLVKPLVFLLEHVPLIGGTVAQAIADVTGNVIDWATSWAKKAVDSLVQLVAVPIKAILDLFAMLGGLADTIAAAIAQVGAVAAGAVGLVADKLHTLAVTVGGLVNNLAQAIRDIGTLFSRVAAIIATAIPGAIATVEAWARAFVKGVANALEAELRAVIAAVSASIGVLIAAALAPIRALIGALPAAWQQAIAVAVQPLTLGLGALGDWVRQAVGGILARLSTLEGLLPLLALIPLVGIIPRTIDEFWRTKTKCTDPTCGLLGTLLDGVGAAGELLTGSVLIYLVTRSIDDPDGTAREVAGWADELRPLASEVTQVLAGRSV